MAVTTDTNNLHAHRTAQEGIIEIRDGNTTIARIAWDDEADPENSIGWVIERGRGWEPLGGNCVADEDAIQEAATNAELIAMVLAEVL